MVTSPSVTAGFAEMDRIPHVPQRVIDTHIHLWDPDRLAYPWLSAGFDELPGRYLPRDFQRDAADVNLIATVHVQAEIDHDLDPVLETEWLDELADAHETPTAIIGYADLRDPALGDVLARHARSPRFRGIRQEAWFDPQSRRADIPRVNLLDDVSWVRGLRMLAEQGLVFELLVWPSQLDQAASILREIPELVVVLEHTGLPYAAPSMADWSHALAGFFSAVPSARLKISALGLSDPTWKPATINPLIHVALDAAGPDRCVLASNYPVERPNMRYGQIWDAFEHALEDLNQVERDAVFATNAAAIYGLSTPIRAA